MYLITQGKGRYRPSLGFGFLRRPTSPIPGVVASVAQGPPVQGHGQIEKPNIHYQRRTGMVRSESVIGFINLMAPSYGANSKLQHIDNLLFYRLN